MHIKQVILFLLTLAACLAIRVSHQQYAVDFYCCPDTYIFDIFNGKCICPPGNSIDIAGYCVNCQPPQTWD